jgi:hypothetical protein
MLPTSWENISIGIRPIVSELQILRRMYVGTKCRISIWTFLIVALMVNRDDKNDTWYRNWIGSYTYQSHSYLSCNFEIEIAEFWKWILLFCSAILCLHKEGKMYACLCVGTRVCMNFLRNKELISRCLVEYYTFPQARYFLMQANIQNDAWYLTDEDQYNRLILGLLNITA